MAEKNRQIAEAVVKAVGGTANITSVTHCMTRLRFVLKDKSIPNKKEVEKIPGVMGVNIAGGTVSSQTHECAPQPHHILNSKIIKT